MSFDNFEHVQEKKGEWTVAVDLDLSFPDKDLKGRHLGAEQKAAMLNELSAETAGKPVTIVAQTLLNDGQLNGGRNDPGKTILHRFAIRDGRVWEIAALQAGTFGSDLQGLMQTAIEKYPAAKLGLVISSHGGGGAGMNGTDSWMEVPELEKTLSQSLLGSGHAKLDLLDFDACLMGQSTVLDHMNSVADNVVASASFENGSTQNLNVWLTDLLEKPEMDGEALGNAIVNDAFANTQKGSGRPGETGTPTLAHFNLKKGYGAFHNSLDELGAALTEVTASKPNQQIVEDALSKIGKYYEVENIAKDPMTLLDLRSFVKDLQVKIGGGLIDDPQSDLAIACMHLLDSQDKMMEAYFAGGIDKGVPYYGGLSVFLPRADSWDTGARAKLNTRLGDLLEDCLSNESIDRRKDAAGELDVYLDDARKAARGFPRALAGLEPIGPQIDILRPKNLTAEQVESVDAAICSAADAALNEEPFVSVWKPIKAEFDKNVERQLESAKNEGAWSNFITEWSKAHQ